MNRIDRLMAMTLYLQGRRVSRAEDMAEHFEISLRTVYRDIAALSEAGVPIVAEAGVGYSLMRGYHMPPVHFTAAEASALATAGVLMRQMTDPSLASSMEAALLKIRAVLPPKEQARVDRIDESTQLSSRSSRPHSASLLQIQQALTEQRILTLDYKTGGRNEITHRKVEPVGLVHYLSYWHLVAWCRLRNDVRDFRLDRIVSIQTESETFTPRPGLTLQSVIEKDHCEEHLKATVHFQESVADRARRDWALGIIQDEPDASGTRLTLTTGSYDWLVGWLLSFRTAATILDPPELRDQVAKTAEEIVARLREQ